ncbi:acyl-CoA dehydrogenase domain protein [Acidimicrobium ferrooxidans DSM 10331]|uniref:Acyl-CoA dehydrogenase domain protein n=1 Tax=Acidimicrobium ferrooxidans (strain DSM 10331 / JCM 15462 / NBRC 103882 / ICP) TaxID=525909 RepID=C7LY74_ACIFD|nr:acyl-CoA dehydrogenase family protein [Acidimicrobium ferrooxidans]ACU53682.1 acyl-CoA dehydrogenase domain protein [Acidimicrobium ferrooxidans DSM 10331]
MTVEFSPEHEQLRSVVADFVAGEVAPNAAAWDREERFPLEAVRTMGKLGLFGIPFPSRYGGGDGDFTSLCIAIEEVAKADSSLAITLSAGVGLGASPIYRFGTDAQRERWLPALVRGEALGAFGLTEPEAGSDAGATRTRAERVADRWRLRGEKAYITNSGTPITSVVTVTARTDEGISAFIVPAGTAGLTVLPSYRKLGWRASDTHGIVLEDAEVGDDALLGAPGAGFRQFLATLDEGRVAIAALALGLQEACLREGLEWAKARNAFGGPIGRFQAIAFKLADLEVAVEASRHLVYRAAWLRDQGRPFAREAAIAKLYATEAAVSAAREATQILGGAGFIEDTPVARYYRDAKILEIGEGTSEIQRLVIARSLGLSPS